MRILLISSAFSGLTQRFYTELEDAGYSVSVELHQGDSKQLIKGVSLFKSDLIICPYLTKRIPKQLYQKYTCLIVHPGIKGDRGPSSLDWAIQNGESEWGVSLLEAGEKMDSGDIWASKTFPMRLTSKSNLFNREVTQAAVDCLWEVLTYVNAPAFKPVALDYGKADVNGRLRPSIRQQDRAINWHKHSTDDILKRIHAADGSPGVLDKIEGRPVYLYNAHRAESLSGQPGEIVAVANGAICRATVDGAIWIGHMKRQGHTAIKLPAAFVIQELLPPDIEHLDIDYKQPGRQLPCQDLWYEQEGEVAYIHSPFHNGGLSTQQCRLLLSLYQHVAMLPVKAIVLMGGDQAWSNGIHLNHIEHARDPAQESWLNINAIDDLIYQIITTSDKLTISAVGGNAGAGGAMMALATDRVFAREGVVFNPHYKNMGGLYGSEYWTYLLPKRVGPKLATALTEQRLPISAKKAWKIGFIDRMLDKNHELFLAQVKHLVNLAVADTEILQKCLIEKAHNRNLDEGEKPLAVYRQQELAHIYANFYGNEAYHQARRQFVYKQPAAETPSNIAPHREGNRLFKKIFGRQYPQGDELLVTKSARIIE